MQKSLQSYETDFIEDLDTSSSLSSAASDFDLLNLNILYESRSKRSKHKSNSDSGSCKITFNVGHHPVHAHTKHEIPLSSHECKSSSFQFTELSETPASAPLLNEHQVTFSDNNQTQETNTKRHDIITSSSYRSRLERPRRSPRIRSPQTNRPKFSSTKGPTKSEKATQVHSDCEHSHSDSERTDKFHKNTHFRRYTYSANSLEINKTWNRRKPTLLPRTAHQSCYCFTDRQKFELFKHRMARHENSPRPNSVAQDLPLEGPANTSYDVLSTLSARDSEECRRVFPFQATPSGNLKIIPNQVVFESKKVSVLVADPKHTKVNVKADLANKGASEATKKKSSQALSHGIPDGQFQPLEKTEDEFFHAEMGDESLSEYHETDDNELTLAKLGFCATEPIDWSKFTLPDKSDLYKLLHHRITNYINPDCVVHIGNEEFNCHLIVLQCYSTYFEKQNVHDLELPESSVTPRAFSLIYDWMIYSGVDSYQLLKRDNILEVFVASHFLGIKELEEQCWAFITAEELLSEDTAFLMYLDAKKKGNTEIVDVMLPRISKFFLTLISSRDFLDLPVDDLCAILSSNYISVHSEMEVFMAAVRWLMFSWEKRKKHLAKVMSNIRFGLIAPWQLVDIRRNPENPEFIEISSFPEVQQFVEDGLAYAIITYWYGNQTSDYFHWIELLGLTEPASRNWIPEDKNYVTYREFLRDLDGYRRNSLLEKKRSKTQKMKPLRSLESQALPSMAAQPSPPQESSGAGRHFAVLSSSLAALIPPPIPCTHKTSQQLPGVEEILKNQEYVNVSNQNSPLFSNQMPNCFCDSRLHKSPSSSSSVRGIISTHPGDVLKK